MTTTTARKSRVVPVHGFKAVPGEPGVFEAVVAVFNNVDHVNDRIIPGAFATSLGRWKASGDPIPVIFSHRWDDLDAHIGSVLEAKELLPGDPLLPPELSTLGGLWSKFRLDVDEPEEVSARKVARLLETRRVKEFSFAYDIVDQRRGSDGANELLELDLIEEGPTLKGANPATRLLSDDGLEPAGRAAKAYVEVDFGGSIEAEQDAVFEAVTTWARGNDIGNGGFYGAYLEATFPGDKRAIVLVEGWDDPCYDGIFYEVDYELAADGTATVSNPREIEITVTTTAKRREWKHRAAAGSATKTKPGATVPAKSTTETEDPPEEANPEDPEGGNGEEPAEDPAEVAETETEETEVGDDPVLVELEILEAELT